MSLDHHHHHHHGEAAAAPEKVKVVILGKEYVGKTCLLNRFIQGNFTEKYVLTVGASFASKRITVDGKYLTLELWDTAGTERYQAVSRMFYRGAEAAIVCYDLKDAESLGRARHWVEELLQHEKACKIYLVGTKADLIEEPYDRAVPLNVVEVYAREISANYYETSAKTGEGVEQLFRAIANDHILSHQPVVTPSPSDEKVEIGKDPAAPAQSWHYCCW